MLTRFDAWMIGAAMCTLGAAACADDTGSGGRGGAGGAEPQGGSHDGGSPPTGGGGGGGGAPDDCTAYCANSTKKCGGDEQDCLQTICVEGVMASDQVGCGDELQVVFDCVN